MVKDITVWLGGSLPPVDVHLQAILNPADTTLGYATYENIIALNNKSKALLWIWNFIHRLLDLFNIQIQVDWSKDNAVMVYLQKVRVEIAKRFPSLLSLYDYIVASLFLNVKFLRSREGFERKMQATRISIEEYKGEGASEIREKVAKSKIAKEEL